MQPRGEHEREQQRGNRPVAAAGQPRADRLRKHCVRDRRGECCDREGSGTPQECHERERCRRRVAPRLDGNRPQRSVDCERIRVALEHAGQAVAHVEVRTGQQEPPRVGVRPIGSTGERRRVPSEDEHAEQLGEHQAGQDAQRARNRVGVERRRAREALGDQEAADREEYDHADRRSVGPLAARHDEWLLQHVPGERVRMRKQHGRCREHAQQVQVVVASCRNVGERRCAKPGETEAHLRSSR